MAWAGQARPGQARWQVSQQDEKGEGRALRRGRRRQGEERKEQEKQEEEHSFHGDYMSLGSRACADANQDGATSCCMESRCGIAVIAARQLQRVTLSSYGHSCGCRHAGAPESETPDFDLTTRCEFTTSLAPSPLQEDGCLATGRLTLLLPSPPPPKGERMSGNGARTSLRSPYGREQQQRTNVLESGCAFHSPLEGRSGWCETAHAEKASLTDGESGTPTSKRGGE